jgi:hypothetical protein
MTPARAQRKSGMLMTLIGLNFAEQKRLIGEDRR